MLSDLEIRFHFMEGSRIVHGKTLGIGLMRPVVADGATVTFHWLVPGARAFILYWLIIQPNHMSMCFAVMQSFCHYCHNQYQLVCGSSKKNSLKISKMI